jgi:two-component system response regulator MprA
MSLILIVDDHAATREPLAKLLKYEGFETASAANGVEALAAVRSRKPDLVLLDLMMPKMDGLAFLSEVAREGQGDALPVIVVTGGLNLGQIRKAGEMRGVLGVMSKAHFTVEGLLARIRRHFAAPAATRRGQAGPPGAAAVN